ncbi:MAG: IPT/TIG domain-containing protein [Bryobacterales bacterium]|nr:IPT/TIG domain-containing protein [Bryobacterales bacterium]
MASSIRAALCLWAMQYLSAQITNLAATADGSVVYFSTKMRPVGTTSSYAQKILSFAPGGPSAVFAEWVHQSGGGRFHEYEFESSLPVVSGDGNVVAYTRTVVCLPGSFCGSGFSWGVIERNLAPGSGQLVTTGEGVVSVSPNGRYAAFHSRGRRRRSCNWLGLLTVVDLATGEKTVAIPGFSLNKEHRPALTTLVASNGTVVGTGSYRKSLFIFDGSSVQTVALTREAYPGHGRPGAHAVPRPASARSEIASYDVASGRERSVVSCAEGAWQPSLSRDGTALLFLSPANFSGRNDLQHVQAFLMRVDGSELRQLTRPEDEITSAVLSGDGRVAYAATARNQMLRISVIDGKVEEVIAATPAFGENSIVSAPGSALEISGSGFDDDVSVLLGDQPIPVLWVTPAQLAVQVPWETPVGEATLALASPAKSSLERGVMKLTTEKDQLRFLRGQCEGDNLSMMTACAPVWLGETLHVPWARAGGGRCQLAWQRQPNRWPWPRNFPEPAGSTGEASPAKWR